MRPATITKDRTAAERSRRYRERRNLRRAGISVTPTATVVKASRSARRGILPTILFCAALGVATVSGAFSIVGLTSVFVGAFWPVIVMGAALESAKLSAVAWLGRRYAASRWLKGVIVTLIVALIGLNAIGCYGFLAKAHIDHAVAGEAQIANHRAHVEARRELAAANVADLDKRITQVDAAVAEATRRGRTSSAMTLAEHQAGRRDTLVADRARAASTLASLEVDAADVENELSQFAADFGPVEYLSRLIGIERETAMRWFIVLVAALLDPLAVVLLLAANARD
jgi:hypothetical protein